MKRNRVLAISLLCIILASTILVGSWALSRASIAYDYATQFAEMAKIGVGSSTNLSLTIYGDPEPARQVFDLFQYVTAKNIEWRGATTDQQGNIINVNLRLASVKFEKLNENNYAGKAEGLDAHLTVGDLLNILVRADVVDVNMAYWSYMDTFPALNVTAVLTGNVEISLFVAVLPIPGLTLALYEYKGDRFTISICAMKPIDVIIERPSDGDRVSGDTKIQALVKAVPAIAIDNVQCWIDNRDNVPMWYNETSGLWEGIWPSYNVGNMGVEVKVRAEGVIRKPGVQESRYFGEDRIRVETNNPWVSSCISRDGGLEWFGGLGIRWEYETRVWPRGTSFNFWPWIGSNLTAPEYWQNGNIRFNSWRIDDEYGNTIFQSPDLTLTITEDVFGKLFNGAGKARELKCIYMPV